MVSGGKRTGAGRPAISDLKRKVTVAIALRPEVRASILDLAREQGISVSALIEKILREEIARRQPLPDSMESK